MVGTRYAWKVVHHNGVLSEVCGEVPVKTYDDRLEIGNSLVIERDFVVAKDLGVEVQIDGDSLRVIGDAGTVSWRWYQGVGVGIKIGPYEVEIGENYMDVKKVVM